MSINPKSVGRKLRRSLATTGKSCCIKTLVKYFAHDRHSHPQRICFKTSFYRTHFFWIPGPPKRVSEFDLQTTSPSPPPITMAPSSMAPTSVAPVSLLPTARPTSQSPTSALPTSDLPTTMQPTSDQPTTQAPTTISPTSKPSVDSVSYTHLTLPTNREV